VEKKTNSLKLLSTHTHTHTSFS